MLKYTPEIQSPVGIKRALPLWLTRALSTQVSVHPWPSWPVWNSLTTFIPSKGSDCTKPSRLSIEEHCWPLQNPVASFWLYVDIPKGASSIPIRKSLPLPLWQSFPSFFTLHTFGYFWAVITFARSLFFIFLPEKPSPFNKKCNTKAFRYGQ